MTNVEVFSHEELNELIGYFDKGLQALTKVDKQRSYECWQNRVTAMLDPRQGMSGGHLWTRGTPKAPPLPLEVTPQGGKILVHPKDIGDHYQSEWTSLWTQCTAADYPKLLKSLKQLYDTAQCGEPLPPITVADIREALKQTKKGYSFYYYSFYTPSFLN